MGAVVVVMKDNSTVCQTGLMTRALDVAQPDLAFARTKGRTVERMFSKATSQLQAHHMSLSDVPTEVTHCPPLVMAEDLHSARTLVLPIN